MSKKDAESQPATQDAAEGLIGEVREVCKGVYAFKINPSIDRTGENFFKTTPELNKMVIDKDHLY